MNKHNWLDHFNAGIRTAPQPQRLRNQKIWVSEWGYPGCLPEAQDLHATKTEAIHGALAYLNREDEAPRGAATALRKRGIYYVAGAYVSIQQAHIADFQE